MESALNTEDWAKLDTIEAGWEGADVYHKTASVETVGLVLDAERRSQNGRSPWFVLMIDGDTMLCTFPQGDTLADVFGIEGTP